MVVLLFEHGMSDGVVNAVEVDVIDDEQEKEKLLMS